MCILQELFLSNIAPVKISDVNARAKALGLCEEIEAARHYDYIASLLQAGLSLRKAVSRLPELTCLILEGVRIEGGDEKMHPWTQLK